MSDEIVTIEEYRQKEIENFDVSRDWDYLESDFFKYKNKLPYDLFFNKEKKVCIKNTSYSGIIQLQNVRLHFSTKVKTNLFYMLSFLKSEEELLMDPEISIEIKEGVNFFDIIGRLFLNELEAIVEKGLLKSYVEKHENLNYLKGKLSIKGQMKNHIDSRPNFSCIYDDLTFNNLENQIVLRSLNLLTPLIRFNQPLKSELIRYEFILKDIVDLTNVSPLDCDSICFNRLNDYYSAIIQFSKLILEEKFIRSIHKGESRGFNFIVNMNKVYEDFITEIVKDVVKKEFSDYSITSQASFSSLVKERKILTRPDLVLRKGRDNYPLILDTKYKREDKNADYYQIISYCLAIPNAKAACLIYPQTESDIDKKLILRRDITTPYGKNIILYTRTVDLHIEKDMEFGEYIQNIKAQIKEIILDCLKEQE
ncbi:MAG: hypothetical protein HPY60_05700 [Candidatus Methanofastidiosum sp.]|nr:hypothetical protein [Methanofastidiosum sp.]